MKFYFYILTFLFFSGYVYGQRILVRGTIKDSSGVAIESAKITLSYAKDSMLIESAKSNLRGEWNLAIQPVKLPLSLSISHDLYDNYTQNIDSLTDNVNLGTIQLKNRSFFLDEVVITSSISPITVKNDTIEFNASSFKGNKNENLTALLKKLPGIEIDNQNTIIFNGKKVNEILVDGKTFFDSDGTIALQNLPADIIDKIQLSDTKTEAEKISGERGSGENISINLTIKKNKNNGYFGKLLGGYGSEKRYESNGAINYFREKQKISLFGSFNNINSGYHSDPIFDTMGRSIYSTGTNSGITENKSFGISYMDSLNKNDDLTLNYQTSDNSSTNKTESRKTTLIPGQNNTNNDLQNNSYISESSGNTDYINKNHNLSAIIKIRPGDNALLSLSPNIGIGSDTNSSIKRQKTFNKEHNELINESNSFQVNTGKNFFFSNRSYYYKKLDNKGRAISGTLNNDNRSDENNTLYESTAIIYAMDGNGTGYETRNQKRENQTTNNQYHSNINYFQPIGDSLNLKITIDYSSKISRNSKQVYDYNTAQNNYTVLNDSLSNSLKSIINTLSPIIGAELKQKKTSGSLELGSSFVTLNNKVTSVGETHSLIKKYVLPIIQFNFVQRISDSKSLSLRYRLNTVFPNTLQLLPIPDFGNTLYTVIGNPNLDPTQTNTVNLAYRNYDFVRKTGYSLYTTAYFNKNQIINYTEIDLNGRQTTTYKNVSGSYHTSINFNWNKYIKAGFHSYKFDFGLNYSFGRQKSFTNGKLLESYNNNISPSMILIYDIGTKASFTAGYKPNFQWQNYNLPEFSSNANINQRIFLQTTSYWPRNLIIGNDIAYSYTTRVSQRFQKGFYLWNTSIGYQLFNGKVLLKMKAYDLLNQNIGTQRTITATEITDQSNTILKRFFLFSLVINIEKFGLENNK
ncbi:outer membrane beta-barrel protein [Flavobacterium sp. ST-75]|uniref:Outer membrane beta-barrel protein n=1 Tax=Flavobacterium rhizophilum TaxID=3163296 RepID=A0ABW8Y7M9_9FLAO